MTTNRRWKVRMDEFGYNVPKAVEDEDGKAVCQFTWTLTRNVNITYQRDRAQMIAAAILVIVCCSVSLAQSKPTHKPVCKDGALDPYHDETPASFMFKNPFSRDPFKCVAGKWVLDEEAKRKREADRAAEEAKKKAEAEHRLSLWNSLRTRVVTDAEMGEILEIGLDIVPEKDGGVAPSRVVFGSWGGQAIENPSENERKNAELVLQAALLNQFKMRLASK
jgi:hypothetical protein